MTSRRPRAEAGESAGKKRDLQKGRAGVYRRDRGFASCRTLGATRRLLRSFDLRVDSRLRTARLVELDTTIAVGERRPVAGAPLRSRHRTAFDRGALPAGRHTTIAEAVGRSGGPHPRHWHVARTGVGTGTALRRSEACAGGHHRPLHDRPAMKCARTPQCRRLAMPRAPCIGPSAGIVWRERGGPLDGACAGVEPAKPA